MELPRVDPVGLAVTPAGFAQSPRVYSAKARLGAALLLGVFASSVLVTTALSLAHACLTTWAAGAWPAS